MQAEEVAWTVQGIRHWVDVMELMNRDQLILLARNRDRALQATKMGDRVALPVDESITMTVAAHMLALSFTHIAKRLKILQGWKRLPDEARQPTRRFLERFESEEIKDLRDGLEHSADYLAGRGDYPERIIVDITDCQTPGVAVQHAKHVTQLRLFGRLYPVGDLIVYAREIRSALI
jgi:hypothetical protein